MSKTLLLADDSVVIQKLVGLSFANEDVEIVSTDNGDDAVVKAREIRPDVVLADVVMPGKSGYEVCEAIKQDPALAHIPVLLLTGTFEAFDESRATGAGADGHITKPFEAQALVERVKTVIKNARPPATAPAPATAPSPGRASASVPTADDLFDDEAVTAAPAGRSGFFGRPESLDVTPSLSEDDLGDALDADLFGPPGSDVGGPSLTASLGAARSASLDSPLGGASNRYADAPIEDATIAVLPEPTRVAADGATRSSALADDLGFDDPIEVHELPLAAFDLDSAFDPAPPAAPPAPATSLLDLAQDDSNAATSPSLDRIPPVTNLDDLLAMPTALRADARSTTPPPAAQPERATVVDLDRELAPDPSDRFSNQVVSDLDFGFDVSEQAPVSQVDLLEESFSSLLDVSDSQLLGDPAPTRPPVLPPAAVARSASPAVPAATSVASLPSMPPTSTPPSFADATGSSAFASSPGADFDVSSSDLATASPLFATPPPIPPAPAQASAPASAPTPAPSVAAPSVAAPRRTPSDFDDFLPTGSLLPSAEPTAASERSASGAAVNNLSPILQQQVQETLEKVAWEAFSDLSETIVKQVIERIERIAWEVIPQMAETLIREEIRQLKGEED